jgi:hypothetical protein
MLRDLKTVITIKEAIIYSIENTLVWYEKNNVKILFLNGRPVFKFNQ